MEDDVTLERVEELFEFLSSGQLPEGVTMEMHSGVGPYSAMRIIWFLQEITGVIPSNFEMCQRCFQMYDTDEEGMHLETGKIHHLCENCVTEADRLRHKKENG